MERSIPHGWSTSDITFMHCIIIDECWGEDAAERVLNAEASTTCKTEVAGLVRGRANRMGFGVPRHDVIAGGCSVLIRADGSYSASLIGT